LLRIPEDFEIQDEPEDEFECLNLDITAPVNASASEKPLPVLIWIYGVIAYSFFFTEYPYVLRRQFLF
jgi:hypothetical protein